LWPIFIAAGFTGFVLYDLQAGVPVAAIALFIAADTIQILIAALCLSSFFDGVPRLNSVTALGKYFLAVVLASSAAAFVSSPGILHDYWSGWRTAFLADLLAFLTLAPAVLGVVASGPEWARNSRARHLEAAGLFAALLLFGYVALVMPERNSSPAMLFSLVPFLLWSALRFGPTGVSISMLVVTVLSIYGAANGRGLLAGPGPTYNVVSLQLFLLFAVTPFMVLAALVAERNRAEGVISVVNRRLIEAQEQERSRIARELHDDIGQRVALLAVTLEELRKSPGDSSAEAQIGALSQQVSDIAADIHSLSHELHSSKLEYLGLAAAMRGFCEEFAIQEDVEIAFESRNFPRTLSTAVSLCLFRVLQEALRNAAKHSGAGHFEVRLWGTPREGHLTVTDGGVGFDRRASIEGHGLGLISMEERLKLVNGTLSIESRSKRGTVVHARVPIPLQEDI